MKMSKPIRRRQIRRKKKGICQFLYEKLEDHTFKLAQWTNKEEGEFSLHWLHASSGTWKVETDSELFRLWAIHKGRFTDDNKEEKYKTWKANFRCAMKSRFELKEIKVPPKCRKKDVKYWKFTDLSFVKLPLDSRQKENRDDDFPKKCSETSEMTKNSRSHRARRKPKLEIDYNESDEDAKEIPREKHYNLDSDSLIQDFNLLSAKDNFIIPLNEDIETTRFMDILEQDKTAEEELIQFRTPSYSHLHPVSIDELDINSNSDIDMFLSNQIISSQIDARVAMYEYKSNSHQLAHFYSDPIPKRPDVSIL